MYVCRGMYVYVFSYACVHAFIYLCMCVWLYLCTINELLICVLSIFFAFHSFYIPFAPQLSPFYNRSISVHSEYLVSYRPKHRVIEEYGYNVTYVDSMPTKMTGTTTFSWTIITSLVLGSTCLNWCKKIACDKYIRYIFFCYYVFRYLITWLYDDLII
jgi:hypothetical protein